MDKRGFTIIELLVVIAVIALLLAVAFPAMRTAKHQANRMHCSSNLRQLSFGFLIYQQEYDIFPYGFSDKGLGITMPKPPEGDCLGSGDDKEGWWWLDFLRDVIEIDMEPGSIAWCPARRFTEPGVRRNPLCGNYGVNRSVCKDAEGQTGCVFSGEPLRTHQVRTPAETLLISDSGYSLLSWMAAADISSPVFENPDRVDFFYIPGLKLNHTRNELADNLDAIKGRHPNQTLNTGFSDGHNEVRSAETLMIESASFNQNQLPSLWVP